MRYYRLNQRLLWRSPLFWIYCTLNAVVATYFMFFHVRPENYINGFFLLGGMQYLQITLFVFSFCIAVYFAQASAVPEASCLVPKGKIRLWRFVALFTASCCLVVLLLVYCIIDMIRVEASFLYCLRSAVAIVAQYGLLIFLAQSLGFAVGSLGRSVFLYLAVIPAALLFTHLNESFFQWLTADIVLPIAKTGSGAAKFSDLLSVNLMNPHGWYSDFAGPMLDSEFWLRLGTKLMIGLSAVLAITCHWSRKPRRGAGSLRLIGCMACLGLSAALGVMFFHLYPTLYRSDVRLVADYHYDTYTPGYHIAAYDGSIEIGEPCKVQCAITLVNDGGGDLVLRLDDGFTPTFTCDGKVLSYTEKHGMLIISADQLPQSDSFVLNAVYKNRIYYISELNNLELFATSSGLAALPSSFALLPEIPNDKTIHDYSITVEGGLTLASNLNVEGKLLSGQASTVCLFSGFFDTVTLDDMTVIQADGNGMIQTEQCLQTIQSYGAYRDGDANKTVSGEFAPKKLLLLRYMYDTGGFPVLYGDYGISNFGFQ